MVVKSQVEPCDLIGHRGYIIGRASTEIFRDYFRIASRDADFFDGEETSAQRAVKRLVCDFHPEMTEWLRSYQCLTHFFWIEDRKQGLVSLGIAFHPSQRHLETMFILRWS